MVITVTSYFPQKNTILLCVHSHILLCVSWRHFFCIWKGTKNCEKKNETKRKKGRKKKKKRQGYCEEKKKTQQSHYEFATSCCLITKSPQNDEYFRKVAVENWPISSILFLSILQMNSKNNLLVYSRSTQPSIHELGDPVILYIAT